MSQKIKAQKSLDPYLIRLAKVQQAVPLVSLLVAIGAFLASWLCYWWLVSPTFVGTSGGAAFSLSIIGVIDVILFAVVGILNITSVVMSGFGKRTSLKLLILAGRVSVAVACTFIITLALEIPDLLAAGSDTFGAAPAAIVGTLIVMAIIYAASLFNGEQGGKQK